MARRLDLQGQGMVKVRRATFELCRCNKHKDLNGYTREVKLGFTAVDRLRAAVTGSVYSERGSACDLLSSAAVSKHFVHRTVKNDRKA